MPPTGIWIALVAVALLVTNGYWWRRLSQTEAAVETSREWDEAARSDERIASGHDDVLEAAAAAAAVPPAELPERVETYDQRISDQESTIKHLRSAWAESWWEALERDAPDPSSPRFVTVTLPRGGHDAAREFAIHAMEQEKEVAVAVGNDGAFAVGVGEAIADDLAADELAREVAEAAGGGAGGSDQLATGGAASTGEVLDAVERRCERIETRIEAAVDGTVQTSTSADGTGSA